MTERFSASVAGRHIACTASANLEIAIPNWQPPVEDRAADNAANRGTAKHKMLEPIMELPAKDIGHMARVLDYVAEVRSRRRFKVLVEEPIKATWLQKQPSTTADLVLYTQDELHVLDQKWGRIEVPVVGNEQLLFYAACYAPFAPKAKGVSLHILQPYADNFEEWYVSADELRDFMDLAIATEKKVLAGDVTFGPSDHCKFCPANPHTRGLKGKPLCPEMMQLLYPTTAVDEAAVLDL